MRVLKLPLAVLPLAAVLGLALLVPSTSRGSTVETRLAAVQSSSVKQIPVLCFHDIGTPSSLVGSIDYYNTTLANFKAEMAMRPLRPPSTQPGWRAHPRRSRPSRC